MYKTIMNPYLPCNATLSHAILKDKFTSRHKKLISNIIYAAQPIGLRAKGTWNADNSINGRNWTFITQILIFRPS